MKDSKNVLAEMAQLSRASMGHWSELHEIGGIALCIASAASSYSTGSCISVDGGEIAVKLFIETKNHETTYTAGTGKSH